VTRIKDLSGVVLGGMQHGSIRSPFEHLHRLAIRIEVDLVTLQAVHLRQAVLPEVPEHLVKRAVLHHHDDDVANVTQPR
jgi:hypothetical protein